MKKIITLCLAFSMAMGTLSAAKVFRTINFENGQTKFMVISKTAEGSKVIDVDRGEKNKKALEAVGPVIASFIAEKAGTNYKMDFETKYVAGAKPTMVVVRTINPETKKMETIKKMALTKEKTFKKNSIEFQSKYPKSKIAVTFATDAKDGKVLIDNIKFTDLDM